MKNISLIVLLIFSTLATQAQNKKKWDVNNPETGIRYKDIAFSTSEGTWMCLDVSPNGQTIVFDLLGDIYSMPATGGSAYFGRTTDQVRLSLPCA